MALNLIWHSAPAFFPTGYGLQTKNFASRLIAIGHEVAIVTTTASMGMMWQGLIHLPGGEGKCAVDGAREWAKRLEADLVVTLFDIWPFPLDFGTVLENLGAPWAAYAPIDHDPCPKAVAERLRSSKYQLAMSPYTVREMTRLGHKPHYIPHGVDTQIYTPQPQHKELFDARNKFVVGIVASNVEPLDRKGWKPTIDAFGKFFQNHPDSRLYAHTALTRSEGGLDLVGMAEEYGVRIWAPDMWQMMSGAINETKMAELYSSFDVLMMLTRGEGFGVPLIEAQACGTPVIVTDFTAPSDLVGAGWKIPIVGKRFTPMNSWWAEPDVDAAVEALEEAYELWKAGKLRTEMRDKARAFAGEFDFNLVVEKHWIPFLEEVEGKPKSGSPHIHQWATIGWIDEYAMCIPCLSNKCAAELRAYPDGRREINPGGFADAMRHVSLDIEDDPSGGVSKVVMREIANFYKFDEIDFQAGDVVVDIGAHVGIISIYLANKHPDIQVYAYEPMPANFKRLLRNIEANETDNVIAVNKAVTSDGRDIELYGDIEKSSGSPSMYGDGTKTEAKSVTLKEIFEEHEIVRCKLLKIDCEGAEYEILKGSSETLTQVDHMRGEFHHIEGESIDDLIKFCEGFVDDVVITLEVGNEKKKSNDRGGQKTSKQLSGGRVHHSKQRKKKDNRSKRRRKNR